ncbi:hypothetical protein C8Q74DRAFT_318422 [Fomes fomentarius]|nr:hypothetical protein C8Q74DRAFT_318422 [Fomes fomentarius]
MASLNVNIQFLDSPTESFTDEAVEVFASVMKADPASIALTGGNLDLIPDLGRCMIRALALTPGIAHTWAARDDYGTLVGFTIFSLPGVLMLSTDEQRENGKAMELMSKLSPEGQQYYAETQMGKEVPQVNDEAFGIKESERSTYWCNFAMVRADWQGKGVAKAMFQRAYHEAEKSGANVALTTTNIRNVPIYEKIGLKYYGERVMQSPWVEWRLWFFMKETAAQDKAAIAT